MRTYHDPGTDQPQTITPARETAQALYDAFVAVQEARDALQAAKSAVPSYTGQWSPVDYFGAQEEALNRAIDAFEDAVLASRAVR